MRSKRIIIHRDLKPGNLMLGGIPFDTDDGSIAQVCARARLCCKSCHAVHVLLSLLGCLRHVCLARWPLKKVAEYGAVRHC